jgi:hypothetical protein
MATPLQLSSEQEQIVLTAPNGVSIVALQQGRKFIVMPLEAYEKMRDLRRVDEVEDSLCEFEDLPDTP